MFWPLISLVVVGDLVLVGLRVAQTEPRPVPPVFLPGPAVTAPVQPPVIAQRDFVADSAQRQRAKVRWVPLGDLDLSGYCEENVGLFSLAVRIDGEWACVRMGEAPAPIPVTAACRAQYDDSAAVARLAAQTWRCYRDVS